MMYWCSACESSHPRRHLPSCPRHDPDYCDHSECQQQSRFAACAEVDDITTRYMLARLIAAQ